MEVKKYLIIGATTEQYFRAAEYIQKKYRVEPALWTVPNRYINQISDKFQDTLVLDHYLFLRGDVEKISELIDADIEELTMPLTREWQESYSSERLMVLEDLLHRTDPGGNYTLSEMTETINNYFMIANAVIGRFKPSLIIFPDAPHLPFDLTLYYIAKKKGIEVSFTTNTHIPNISFTGDSITGPHNFFNLGVNNKFGESEKEELFINTIQSTGKETPFYMRSGEGYLAYDTYARPFLSMMYDIAISALSSLKWFFINKINLLGFFDLGKTVERYSKIKNKDLWKTSGNSYFVFRHVVINIILEIFYNYKSKSFSNSFKEHGKKYVYIPLSMQKERTTMPCAGYMHDQSLFIKQIINFLPDDWFIVIKENPKQFRHNTGVPARNLRFYRKFIQSGVLFAPLDYSSNELISNSSAVCVTTGTAGFESVVGFSKPVLSFADSWYSSMPGVIKIKNTRDIKKAFELIRNDKVLFNKNEIKDSVYKLMDQSFLLTFAPLPDGKYCEYVSLNLASIWSSLLNYDERTDKQHE